MAVAIEHQPRAEMHTTGQLRLLAEDHLEVLQPGQILTEPTAPYGRSGHALFAGFGIAEIHQPVGLKVRRQPYVQQAALRAGEYIRHPGQRLGKMAIQID